MEYTAGHAGTEHIRFGATIKNQKCERAFPVDSLTSEEVAALLLKHNHKHTIHTYDRGILKLVLPKNENASKDRQKTIEVK